MIPQTGTHPRFDSTTHETSEDVSLGVIVGFAAAMVALCTMAACLLAAVMWYVQVGIDREQENRPPLFNRTEKLYGEAAPPVEHEDPYKEFKANPESVPDLKLAQEAIGEQAYQWLEPGKTARIPIDRAIAILGEKDELPRMPVSTTPAASEPTPADAVRRAQENPAPQPPVPAETSVK